MFLQRAFQRVVGERLKRAFQGFAHFFFRSGLKSGLNPPTRSRRAPSTAAPIWTARATVTARSTGALAEPDSVALGFVRESPPAGFCARLPTGSRFSATT